MTTADVEKTTSQYRYGRWLGAKGHAPWLWLSKRAFATPDEAYQAIEEMRMTSLFEVYIETVTQVVTHVEFPVKGV